MQPLATRRSAGVVTLCVLVWLVSGALGAGAVDQFNHEYPTATCGGEWHWVHVQTSASSGTLTVDFAGKGEQTITSTPSPSVNLHYSVWLNAGDTLTSASDDVGDGKLLLSHWPVCEQPQRGSITVEKKTGSTTGEAFLFQLQPGSTVPLGSGGSFTWTQLEPQTYDLVELLTVAQREEGWSLTDVSCKGGEWTELAGLDGARISLAEGDDLHCTFVDNRQPTTPSTPVTPSSESGEIRIVKKAAGTERFSFEASWLPSGFTLADGETASSGSLNPGVYWVNEVMSAEQKDDGWRFASATCSDGSPINAIRLGAGEVVTCTFENAQVMAEVVVATTTTTIAVGVADLVVATLPFTGTNAVGLSMIALFLLALGGLVVLAAAPIRED
jgi:hypothetical protein